MRSSTRGYYEVSVRRAIEHIAEHLGEATDLEELARGACLSPFHFHRIFKGMAGETPVELARRLRLERAALALASTKAPVTMIAFEAGYETHEAFTRAFRAAYADSPTGFRARGRDRTLLGAVNGVHYSPGGGAIEFVPRDTGGKNMDVTVKELPEVRLAARRFIGPYQQINQAFGELGQIAAQAGLARDGMQMVAVYYDIPQETPADRLRSDAGLTIAPGTPIPPGLHEVVLPAGRYAITTFVGPYERLADVWPRFMGEWLPASGHRLGEGVSFEVYLNDASQVEPEHLVTELVVPILAVGDKD